MPFTLSVKSFTRRPTTDVVGPVSTASNGAQANSDSGDHVLSADGRYLVFTSAANNLVTGDTKGKADIFRKDLLTGEVVRVSITKTGEEANGDSSKGQISADGRYVLFQSSASNLVTGDTNNKEDVFRKDLQSGEVVLVSKTKGAQADGNSSGAQFGADVNSVVFVSTATNLVTGDTNKVSDIFRKDLQSGDVVRLSTTTYDTQADNYSSNPVPSADGRYLVFTSRAANLVGNVGDNNGKEDVFRKDLQSKEVICISTISGKYIDGTSYRPQVSADGRYVVFVSTASILVPGDDNGQADIFRKDLTTGEIVRVSTAANGAQGNNTSGLPHMSADGRYVAFASYADNLVQGDTNGQVDIFRKDLTTGEIVRVSAAADGTQANNNSDTPRLSADGRYVMFHSEASNLMPGDANSAGDIFRVDMALLPQGPAIAEGRHVRATLSVGTATSVSVAWGDGSADTVKPAGGSAAFSHVYAAAGTKAATVTLVQGAQSWIVPFKIDLSKTAMARNTALADTQIGGKGKDALKGDAYANILKGMLGNDTLTGGKGRDVFVFETKPNKKTNLDKIVDFNAKDDSFWLDNLVFKKLGKGTPTKPLKLNKAFFTIGDKAKDKNDYLVYDKIKGVLSYDIDGSGAKAAVAIATLKKGLKMTYADFFVI